jgi:hypothetical protein
MGAKSVPGRVFYFMDDPHILSQLLHSAVCNFTFREQQQNWILKSIMLHTLYAEEGLEQSYEETSAVWLCNT